MKKIKISVVQHFTKEATIEIDYPENINFHTIVDYLCNNSHYQESLEDILVKTDYDFEHEEYRYDVIETKTLIDHLYGGTL